MIFHFLVAFVDPVGVEPTSKQGISEFSTCLYCNWLSIHGRPQSANHLLILCFLTANYKIRPWRSPFDGASLHRTRSRVAMRDLLVTTYRPG